MPFPSWWGSRGETLQSLFVPSIDLVLRSLVSINIKLKIQQQPSPPHPTMDSKVP